MTNTSIDNKFHDKSNLFGLQFREGVVFLAVRNFEELKIRPYTGLSDIDSESTLADYQRIEDDDSDDMLKVPIDESDKVKHVSIGHKPYFLRRYTNYPAGENRLRKLPNIDKPVASNGDNFGYVDGVDSPYENPTDAEELYIPPGEEVDFNYYNPDPDENHQPVLSVKMRIYKVDILQPTRDDDMKNIRRVAKPGSAPPIMPVGSLDFQSSFNNLSEKWDVEPMPIERARDLGKGGR